MFVGYEDLEAYEDELYCEASSSEAEIDSDVEFQLYSQMHYANNLTGEKMGRERSPTSSDLETATVKDRVKSAGRSKIPVVISDSDVIVISDSPDVIVLSDSEDGNSVYACKGVKASECKISEREKQSIGEPAQGSAKQTHHLCRKSPQIHERMIMIKGSASSEPEDEKIESWMVLGEENDADIQLNIEDCGTLRNKEGDLHTHWSICEKDLKSSFRKKSSRYYAPNKKKVDCRNCGKLGHIAKNCPSPKKLPACFLCGVRGHPQRCCPKRYCTNCNMPGHWFQNCIERANWKRQCHRCQMTGHYADACPEIWRQYHLTTNQGPIINGCSQPAAKESVYCYNCSKKGHYGHECSSEWMQSHTFPTLPFVCYYDTKHDIKMREWRIQKRFKELRDAGILKTSLLNKRTRRETASEEPLTKKARKKRKKELMKKKRLEQEGRESRRRDGMAKRKGRCYHQTSHCPKTSSEGVEEDFPRGFAAQSVAISAPQYKTQQGPLLFMHSNITQNEEHLDPIRRKRNRIRKKKKHAEREIIDLTKRRRAKKTKVHVRQGELSAPDNVAIMKQKKKCKKHPKIKSQESV